jgi:hypothetical protein
MPEFKNIHFNTVLKENIKIAVISDMHIDYKFKNRIFLEIMDKIEREKPDLIVFLGDLIDPGFELSQGEMERIKNLKIRKIGILGNHEYYFGVDKAIEIYKKLDIEILRNDSKYIKPINFIGFSDMKTESITAQMAIEIFKKNYRKDSLNIVLSHQPLYFKEFSSLGEVYMFSGHTHRGQIFPFHIFTKMFYGYFYGIYEENKSFLYVTSGCGSWWPPMRFMADSEIPLIEFSKER